MDVFDGELRCGVPVQISEIKLYPLETLSWLKEVAQGQAEWVSHIETFPSSYTVAAQDLEKMASALGIERWQSGLNGLTIVDIGSGTFNVMDSRGVWAPFFACLAGYAGAFVKGVDLAQPCSPSVSFSPCDLPYQPISADIVACLNSSNGGLPGLLQIGSGEIDVLAVRSLFDSPEWSKTQGKKNHMVRLLNEGLDLLRYGGVLLLSGLSESNFKMLDDVGLLPVPVRSVVGTRVYQKTTDGFKCIP